MTTAGVIGLFTAALGAESGASQERDNGGLTGQVVDAVTHDVLDSVQVKVKGSDVRANSSSDGSFALDKLVGNKVALVISRPGYKTREVSVFVTTPPLKWTVALWPAR